MIVLKKCYISFNNGANSDIKYGSYPRTPSENNLKNNNNGGKKKQTTTIMNNAITKIIRDFDGMNLEGGGAKKKLRAIINKRCIICLRASRANRDDSEGLHDR